MTWLGEDISAYEAAYDLRTAKTDDPWTGLIRAIDVLNNTSLEELADSLDAVLAVDRALWYLAVENVWVDTDSYWFKGADYRLYYEVETGRIHTVQHDGNEVMLENSTTLNPLEGEGNENRPLIDRLLSVPAYRQRYLAHMRTILDESFDLNFLVPRMEAYRALIEDEVRADTKKLYTDDDFENDFAALSSLIQARRDFLLSHPEIAQSAPQIVSVERRSDSAGPELQITAEIGGEVAVEEVILYYANSLTGRFNKIAMVDDGTQEDGGVGDGVYGGKIPAHPVGSLVRYYVEARAADGVGTASFAPVGAEHDVFIHQIPVLVAESSPIVINELMASNRTVFQDPQDEYDDWIELLNVSDQDVDLSGMYLTDREDLLLKWIIPEGTILAPGAYLIVWADEDGSASPGLHANFKLSAGGETLMLVDSDERGNLLLDSVSFSAQETNISLGRYPNGMGEFQVMPVATPRSENTMTRQSNSDFDGDGVVGFTDFLQFARAFGTSQGDAEYHVLYDLDGDGAVDFSDFLQFAQAFGQTASSKPVGRAKPTVGGVNEDAVLSLDLEAASSFGQTVLVARLTGATGVAGYTFQVLYDPSTVTFFEAKGMQSSVFGEGLAISPEPGRVLLADVLQSDGLVQEGDLVRLVFRNLVEHPAAGYELTEIRVADGMGEINILSLTQVRPIPSDYMLHQNFPNPFNPDTQIAYEIPKTGEVRLAVYNMLGQEIRTLVQGVQAPGFYRMIWDGNDAAGRPASSGVYFVKLQTDGFVDVRRMLLLK
ncbi:MAG: CotH kinase family protein [bacterium]|nr:CotH kinase family protein [bacterium]